ncbi:MAG: universal stress protein [Acidimicrobiales bacterium]
MSEQRLNSCRPGTDPLMAFSNILFVPLKMRGNPAAIRKISAAVERNRAELTVMGVVEEQSRFHRLLERAPLDSSIRDAEQRDLVERLGSYCEALGLEDAHQLLRSGIPPLTIIEQAIAGRHDLVVVTTDDDRHDHATIKRLLRKCPCPVWVIRPTRAKVQRILAAVNPSPAERGLNREILGSALAMHDLFGGELHVVHTWKLQGESTLRNSAFLHTPPDEVDRLVDEEHEFHSRAFDELLEDDGGEAPWQPHLIEGSPAEAIPDLMKRKRINLLVMGTVARTGIAGLLVGNTAEQLIDDVRCSVIAVKPPGFVSPVASSS